MAPWKTPTQVAKNQNFHAVSSCNANSAMRKYAPMQTKINFSDSNLRASFPKRMDNWIIWAAVTFVPGLGVPVWLSVLLDIPYLVLASSLLIGQCICGIASVMLVTALERVGAGKLFAFDGGKQ